MIIRLGRFGLCTLIACAGCGPLYMAPAAHAPLFSHGGEMHAAGQISDLGQMDGQVALAPMDHLGLVAALSIRPAGDNDNHEH